MELKRWFSANDNESEVLEASVMGSITVHDRTKMHILMRWWPMVYEMAGTSIMWNSTDRNRTVWSIAQVSCLFPSARGARNSGALCSINPTCRRKHRSKYCGRLRWKAISRTLNDIVERRRHGCRNCKRTCGQLVFFNNRCLREKLPQVPDMGSAG